MRKRSVLLIFIFLLTHQAFSQTPDFMFYDSVTTGGSPVSKTLIQKNQIKKIVESKQNIKHTFYAAYFYDTLSNLIKIERYGTNQIVGSIDSFVYDQNNKVCKEMLYNTKDPSKIFLEFTHKYIGDTIEVITCYVKNYNKLDTSAIIKYFNNNKQIVKYEVLGKDYNRTVLYEYDNEGMPTKRTHYYKTEITIDSYEYVLKKKGKKIVMKQSGGSNNGGITECTYNTKNQCVKCNLDWKELTVEYKFEYNDDGTLATNKCIRERGTDISKYTYFK